MGWVRPVLASILALAFLLWPFSAPAFTGKYDRDIKAAVEYYWGPGEQRWQLWKAQLIAESGLDPEAVSPAGARGLAQFTPATWREVSRRLQFGMASPHEEYYAIRGGAFYMAQLRRTWNAPRSADDRHSLAMASYNAGAGNILDAQRLCGGATYSQVVACLPQVTGRHAQETLGYVPRIWRTFQRLQLGG